MYYKLDLDVHFNAHNANRHQVTLPPHQRLCNQDRNALANRLDEIERFGFWKPYRKYNMRQWSQWTGIINEAIKTYIFNDRISRLPEEPTERPVPVDAKYRKDVEQDLMLFKYSRCHAYDTSRKLYSEDARCNLSTANVTSTKVNERLQIPSIAPGECPRRRGCVRPLKHPGHCKVEDRRIKKKPRQVWFV